MDCQRALDTVMRAADLDLSEVEGYREALDHCYTCPSCSRTARGLVRLGRIPGPSAPSGVADRVLAAVAEERALQAARAESEHLDALSAETGLYAAPPPSPRAPAWLRWSVAAGSIAAVLIGMFVMAGLGLRYLGFAGSTDGGEMAAAPAPVDGTAEQYKLPTPGADGGTGDAAEADRAAPEEAPGFVAYDGRVWRVLEGTNPDRSTLATQGTVTTDLGTGSSGRRTVLTSPTKPESIVVSDKDGSLTTFTLVKRLYHGATFVMVSDGPIKRFGQWPDLPDGIPDPVDADGSPTFRAADADDMNVTVYPRTGRDPGGGFAIAPGTPIGDPAAGNPNWTWWVAAD